MGELHGRNNPGLVLPPVPSTGMGLLVGREVVEGHRSLLVLLQTWGAPCLSPCRDWS